MLHLGPCVRGSRNLVKGSIIPLYCPGVKAFQESALELRHRVQIVRSVRRIKIQVVEDTFQGNLSSRLRPGSLIGSLNLRGRKDLHLFRKPCILHDLRCSIRIGCIGSCQLKLHGRECHLIPILGKFHEFPDLQFSLRTLVGIRDHVGSCRAAVVISDIEPHSSDCCVCSPDKQLLSVGTFHTLLSQNVGISLSVFIVTREFLPVSRSLVFRNRNSFSCVSVSSKLIHIFSDSADLDRIGTVCVFCDGCPVFDGQF